jgi:hypothetical protein
MGIVQNWAATAFPANLDSVAGSFPLLTDLVHDIVASHPNSLASAVQAIEAKVGIDDSAVVTAFDYVLKKGRHTSKQPGGSTGSVAFVLDSLNAHSGTDKLLSLRSATTERFAVGGGGATDTYWDLGDGQAVGVGPAGKVRFRYDGATNKAQVSENGGAFADIAGGGAGGAPNLVTGAVNEDETVLGVERVVGGFVFMGATIPAGYTAYFRLVGVFLNGAAVGNARIRLYDLGPAAGPPVAGVLRSTVSIGFAIGGGIRVAQAALTPNPAPGVNIDQIDVLARAYEIRVILDSVTPGDTMKVLSGGIAVE